MVLPEGILPEPLLAATMPPVHKRGLYACEERTAEPVLLVSNGEWPVANAKDFIRHSPFASPEETRMQTETLRVNGIDLFVRSVGDPTAPLVLFLHGFPEYSGAWDAVLPAFAGTFHAVAPDQRGYARSSKPEGVDAYRIKHLVRDVLALGDRLSPGRPFALVGHDWGASVAYAAAIAAPARISRLAVINGVHPGPFQRALIEDEAQRKASSYIHYLRDPRAEERLSANGFEKLLAMMQRFGPQPWLTPEKRAAYIEAWSAPGALTGMLNWYRASPLVVPDLDETVDPAKVIRLDPAQLRIRMPHLVIWGMNDQALPPSSLSTLADYCDDLTVREIAGADHWVVHQKGGEVVGHLKAFLEVSLPSRL